MIDLFLRIYIECFDELKAQEFSDDVNTLLDSCCDLSLFKIEKYWKIEECFEVAFDLQIKSTNQISQVLDLLGIGWEEISPKKEYLWKPSNNSSFFYSKVIWAHLEHIES